VRAWSFGVVEYWSGVERSEIPPLRESDGETLKRSENFQTSKKEDRG